MMGLASWARSARGKPRSVKDKDVGSSNSKGKVRETQSYCGCYRDIDACACARARVCMQVPAGPDRDPGSNKNTGSAGDVKPRSAASFG